MVTSTLTTEELESLLSLSGLELSSFLLSLHKQSPSEADALLKRLQECSRGRPVVVSQPAIVATLQDVATYFGRTTAAIEKWRSEGMPGERGAWPIREISRWRLDRLSNINPKDVTADPLLTGNVDNSPALERYRLARAQIGELELSQRKQELMSRDAVVAVLRRWAMILRSAHLRLRQKCGEEAAEILKDGVDECEHVVDTELGAGGVSG